MLRSKLVWFCLLISVALVSLAGEVRTWTDNTGKHKVEAELLSSTKNSVKLRKTDGTTKDVQIEKLSDGDQQYIAAQNKAKPNDTTQRSGADDNGISTTYHDFYTLIRGQREAIFVVSLYEVFLASTDVAQADKDRAGLELPKWRELAEKKAIRLGNKWLAPEECKQAREDEIRLVKEAHRLIDIKNDDLAKEKFLEASKANPEGVRANFYLGLLNALVAHHPQKADENFRECVNRLKRDADLMEGARRANYIAALNNLAIIQVRKRDYMGATGLWRKAIETAPFTPELVQNLGLMSKLSQTATYVRIPKEQRKSAGDLYAKSTVGNSLYRFDDNVGWLFMPYVDTVDGAMDTKGDEELVTVGWCTGFSIGGEYILTSRYPLQDADRIVVHDGGNTFETSTGKVVAISNDSHLAVVRIDGLKGKQMPLNLATPRPAQDVVIAGYGSPGLMKDNLQRRTATILDPPHFYKNVNVVVHEQVSPGVSISVHTHGLRQLLVHDAILNAAMEGAPLIDKKGSVVGIHLGNRPEFGEAGSKNSWAESAAFALKRISAITTDVNFRASDAESAPPLDEASLNELTNGSIFQLAVQRRAPRLAWSHRIEEKHRLQKQGSWTSFEDKTCMACNGRLEIKCPDCVRGAVSHNERELKHRDANSGIEFYGSKKVVEKCTTCNGTGYIKCPNCSGDGIDMMFTGLGRRGDEGGIRARIKE